jgi:hypothetical protein
MAKMLYTAIVFFENGTIVRKYRNISNLGSFMRFLEKIEAHYCNLYDKETNAYIKRLYVNK